MPRFVRKSCSFFFNIVGLSFLFDIKRNSARVKYNFKFGRAIGAAHLLNALDGVNGNRKAGQGKAAE